MARRRSELLVAHNDPDKVPAYANVALLGQAVAGGNIALTATATRPTVTVSLADTLAAIALRAYLSPSAAAEQLATQPLVDGTALTVGGGVYQIVSAAQTSTSPGADPAAIAAWFGTTVGDLQGVNVNVPQGWWTSLPLLSAIRLPTVTVTVSAAKGLGTLAAIAAYYGTTVEQLGADNQDTAGLFAPGTAQVLAGPVVANATQPPGVVGYLAQRPPATTPSTDPTQFDANVLLQSLFTMLGYSVFQNQDFVTVPSLPAGPQTATSTGKGKVRAAVATGDDWSYLLNIPSYRCLAGVDSGPAGQPLCRSGAGASGRPPLAGRVRQQAAPAVAGPADRRRLLQPAAGADRLYRPADRRRRLAVGRRIVAGHERRQADGPADLQSRTLSGGCHPSRSASRLREDRGPGSHGLYDGSEAARGSGGSDLPPRHEPRRHRRDPAHRRRTGHPHLARGNLELPLRDSVRNDSDRAGAPLLSFDVPLGDLAANDVTAVSVALVIAREPSLVLGAADDVPGVTEASTVLAPAIDSRPNAPVDPLEPPPPPAKSLHDFAVSFEAALSTASTVVKLAAGPDRYAGKGPQQLWTVRVAATGGTGIAYQLADWPGSTGADAGRPIVMRAGRSRRLWNRAPRSRSGRSTRASCSSRAPPGSRPGPSRRSTSKPGR